MSSFVGGGGSGGGRSATYPSRKVFGNYLIFCSTSPPTTGRSQRSSYSVLVLKNNVCDMEVMVPWAHPGSVLDAARRSVCFQRPGGEGPL